MRNIYQCLLFFVGFSFTLCDFLTCQDIVRTENRTSVCLYCSSQRVADQCKDVCQNNRCVTNGQSSANSSSSASSSNKNSDTTNTGSSDSNSQLNNDNNGSGTGSNTTGGSSKGKHKGKKDKKDKKEKNKPKQNKKKGNKKESDTTASDNNNGSQSNGNSGGAVSSTCDNVEPCVEISAANDQFKKRCKSKGIDDDCTRLCRYNVTKKEIQVAFLQNECDIDQARDFLYAAANDKDNTYCCNRKHALDGDRSLCEPFCNPSSSQWPQKAELKYMRCVSQFDVILKCHWASCRP